MRFLLIMDDGGGCDYSIHCGTRVDEIEADSDAEALQEARKILGREDFGEPVEPMELMTAHLFQVRDVGLQWEGVSRELKQQWESHLQEEKEAKEKAEFERLKRKFRN